MRGKHGVFGLFLGFLLVLAAAAEALPDPGATIDVARFPAAEMKKGIPPGWELENRSGTPVLGLEKRGEFVYLRMKSDPLSSFGIRKAISVDVKEYPFLNWTWMASRLPEGGDARKAETDDQAIQIYLFFPANGFPGKFNTPVIGYLWDTEAPRNWAGKCSQPGGGKVRYLIVRNKTDKVGEWRNEKRNVYQDFKKLFKDLNISEPTGPAMGITLYINSQHTRSSAESAIGDIYFSRQ